MTAPLPPYTAPTRRDVVGAVVASTVGTMIEWYDYFLYGTAAALVFPELFFPQADPFLGQLASFGTFTIGFLTRPLGGALFGHMGDRLGRKAALVATLLLMGVSTVLVGFLPTYDQIGIAAPVLLTLLRVCQGLGVGGEWGGAVLLALEYGSRGRRGFLASWPQAGVPLGLLASTVIMAVCQARLPREDFLSWGWRVPFLLSALLILLGFWIRARIRETPLFARLREQQGVADTPLRDVLRGHWRELLLAAGTRIGENTCFYLFTAYLIAYVSKTLGLDSAVALRAVNAGAVVALVVMPLAGWLSDRWSRRGTYIFGCLFVAAFAPAFYALVGTKDPDNILIAVVIALGIGHATLYAVQASLIPELFGTRLRCTGASLGYQLATPLAGGLAPIVATSLVRAYPGTTAHLAAYVAGTSLLSLACVWRLAETSRKEIGDGR